jgi:uncharacterized protein
MLMSSNGRQARTVPDSSCSWRERIGTLASRAVAPRTPYAGSLSFQQLSLQQGVYMPFAIRHDRAAHRFETEVDGVECELDYTLTAAVMTITHTGVPSEVGGRGIASALVQAAFEAARSEGWKVVPACSYAAVWIGRHAEYRDLRA